MRTIKSFTTRVGHAVHFIKALDSVFVNIQNAYNHNKLILIARKFLLSQNLSTESPFLFRERYRIRSRDHRDKNKIDMTDP